MKPLETKLKYQIDKVVSAAVDEELSKAGTAPPPDNNADSEPDGIDHDDYGDYSRPTTKPTPASVVTNKELSFRPNPLALVKPAAGIPAAGEAAKDGLYRPPRISATAMPELQTTTTRADKEARNAGRKKSHMLDEFVSEELSAAPMAQPSIGSTIVAGGRVLKSARERREEQERRDYEESNFVRLPQLSKKELKKRKQGDSGQFGGEDWRDFAGDLDRLTKAAERGGKSSRLLEKSRKRRGDDDGEKGGGRGLGENFERKRKSMESRAKKRRV